MQKGAPGDCWEWQSTKNQQGYGRFSVYSDRYQEWYSAHRLAWAWANDREPGDLIVCHRCDNPGCCNPAHLFLGTHKDNAEDRDRKGRLGPRAGEDNGRAKLSAADVLSIRASAGRVSVLELAQRFNVSRTNVAAIIRGRIWRNLEAA